MSLRDARASLARLLTGGQDQGQEARNLRNIIISGAFVGFIDGGIVVYLPVYLARLGAGPTLMGLFSSLPMLINMLLYLPGGAFVERQTNLVRLVNWAVFIHRCGYLIIAALPFVLADHEIAWAAVIIWSLINATTAFFWPALLAIVQRSVSPALRPKANGGRWAAMTIVAAILIPILGWVIDHTTFPTGYQLAFVLSFVGAIPNIYFFAKVRVPPSAGAGVMVEERPLGQRLNAFFRPFVESRLFVRYNLATAVFRVCIAMPAGLYSLFWVNDLQATDTQIGLRGMVGFGSLAVGYVVWGRLAHRMGHRLLLFISGATLGVYPIATSLSPSAEWLLPAAVVWGIGIAGIDLGLVDMLLATCPEGRQPSFIAIGNLLASAEGFVGPLIGAALAPLIGVKGALLLSGVLIIVSVALFFLLPNREQEHAVHARA
jgi:MFS family permease